MMKLALSFLLTLFNVYFSYSQDIGIRIGTSYSNTRMNFSKGAGIFFSFEDSAKYDLLLSADFYYKSKEFPDDGYESKALRFNYSIAGVRSFHPYTGINIRTGPSLAYERIDGLNAGLVANWLGPFDSWNLTLGWLVH